MTVTVDVDWIRAAAVGALAEVAAAAPLLLDCHPNQIEPALARATMGVHMALAAAGMSLDDLQPVPQTAAAHRALVALMERSTGGFGGRRRAVALRLVAGCSQELAVLVTDGQHHRLR